MTQRKFLPRHLRRQLENTVRAARGVAEQAAEAALFRLGVGDSRAPDYLSEEEKALRRRLRAHARALGDVRYPDDSHSVQHLIQEIAYQHWHRMLFARFLAENNLLLWEPGAPVSLAECEELAQDPSTSLGATSGWDLAGKLAARMLPQIFRPESPVFEISFAPEHQRRLEQLLAELPEELFHASDSLGWVYQFWQAQRKDEVNASGVKIGAAELPAVTQLFTEPYMVEFLLHNSLGAWWVTRYPDTPCPVELPYLRRLEDGTPAAGRFEGWPSSLAEFKLLDPCCGSGHFLVTAFHMLVPMRMATEGLSTAEAVDAVLANNLFGLEIDPRCVEIAVFALALAAWTYPDETGNPLGVRTGMPAPNIACCGLPVSARSADWEGLVQSFLPNATWSRQEIRAMHAALSQAPLLGSLLDPTQLVNKVLSTHDLHTLIQLLKEGLSCEVPVRTGSESEREDFFEMGLSARGLLEAAHILCGQYHLVVTNVPYLTRGRQSQELKDYCDLMYPESKHDLANVFLERCLRLALGNGMGVVQVVMPQNWLFLARYEQHRKTLLRNTTWNMLVRLGPGAFETISGEIVNVILLTLTTGKPSEDCTFYGLDASSQRTVAGKISVLHTQPLMPVKQMSQLRNPNTRVVLGDAEGSTLLENFARAVHGMNTKDAPRFIRRFWELDDLGTDWVYGQTTVDKVTEWGGLHNLYYWQEGKGQLRALYEEGVAILAGGLAWGRPGVCVRLVGDLPAALYSGEKFDQNCGVIVPDDESLLPAIWCFCSSPEFNRAVRRIDQKLNVTISTLVKVPFDVDYWKMVAAKRYPNGLPKPYSDNPTEWIFHGHPYSSTAPLHVAVARLLGYRWPAESDTRMQLSDEARMWIAKSRELCSLEDDDGIVCLNAVRGEKPAHERLLSLLIAAWESVKTGSWTNAVLDRLLADVDAAGLSLEVWLRDKFFEQHCRLFHHRPFIWHIWDGLKDGFGALVNYHKLDSKNLERLIHTYLGDWIRTQEVDVANGVDGAQQRLVAAQQLKNKLEAILEGEAPYDIFVRWKPLEQQPVGWNPDLNDGVRVNIRPFVTAGVLRHNKPPKLNIKWDKDRGKDLPSSPWYHLFKGERINDYHLTLAEKRAARGK